MKHNELAKTAALIAICCAVIGLRDDIAPVVAAVMSLMSGMFLGAAVMHWLNSWLTEETP